MNKLIAVLFLAAVLVSAQDVMRIKTKDGNVQIVPIAMIQKITFDVPNAVPQQPQILQTMNQVIAAFTLLQNYPNPFNPETKIAFQIPRAERVSVRIYDITGRLVASVLDEWKEAGTHEVLWNGRTSEGFPAASGMYLYEVRYERSVLVRKMLMMK